MPFFFLFFLSFFALFNQKSFANEHSTVIINQVRGSECCSVGELSNLQLQLETASKLQLPTTFSLRYDVLQNPDFLHLVKNYQSNGNFEWAAFLEITPQLAKDAGVEYKGNETNWYEAQFVYLIGYEQAERNKLLETYMKQFQTVFGNYPQTTTAWMIDPFSLQLLKTKYGVLIHQITREQMGVDSYTLYGGPVHYPYYPSLNWALIPTAQKSDQMPIIIRQTITDPVYNYGDSTSSFTAQANDYVRRNANFNYFQHLFLQAHAQSENQDTFALLGLENSMPLENQQEFVKQLEFVAAWRKENQTHQILTAQAFASFFQNKNEKNQELSVYYGQDQEKTDEKAWWITTPFYRARLRLSGKELFVSDLRFYDESFIDPYLTAPAKKLGWWIVPFSIDGSRYGLNDQSQQFNFLFNDSLIKNKDTNLQATRLTLAENVEPATLKVEIDTKQLKLSDDKQTLAIFTSQKIALNKGLTDNTQNALLEKMQQAQLWKLEKVDNQNGLNIFVPVIKKENDLLTKARREHYPLLFPELSEHPLDPQNTYLYKNNCFAIANRNPVRLILFPKDQYGYPITLKTEPTVTSEFAIDQIEVKAQSAYNGMLFLDFSNEKPLKTQVTIEKDGWSTKLEIYFAPDCKQNPFYCLRHPKQALWYIGSFTGDKWRALKEKIREIRLQ